MANLDEAENWLEIAIRRHSRHMNGEEPTSGAEGEISQKLMMQEMKYALKALTDGMVTTTMWYDANIKKYPDKMGTAM